MKPVPAVIADDHEMCREAFARWIAPSAGLNVVGFAATADELIGTCADLHPAVLVLDLDLPGRDVFATIHELKRTSPDTRTIALTGFLRDGLINTALEVGIEGYLLKSDSQQDLIDRVARFVRGERVFSDAVMKRIELGNRTTRTNGTTTPVGSLTRREREVLRYIGRGYGTDDMATMMHLSRRTVERHIQRLMGHLDLHDRAALTRYAFREGIVV